MPRSEIHILFYFFFLAECTGVTLVNKTIQVSSVQLSKTSCAHCVVHPSPKVKSLSPFISPFSYLPLLLLPFPLWLSPHCCHG